MKNPWVQWAFLCLILGVGFVSLTYSMSVKIAEWQGIAAMGHRVSARISEVQCTTGGQSRPRCTGVVTFRAGDGTSVTQKIPITHPRRQETSRDVFYAPDDPSRFVLADSPPQRPGDIWLFGGVSAVLMLLGIGLLVGYASSRRSSS